MQHDLDMTDLGESEPAIFDLKTRLAVCEAVIARIRSEARIAGLFAIRYSAKEGVKGIIKTLQYILQHQTMNGFEIFSGLFDLRQLILLIVIANRYARQFVGIASLLRCAVVKFTAKRTSIIQQFFLALGWIDPIFERLSHLLFPLTLNISLYNLNGSAANGNDKIRWTPKMGFPQPVLNYGKLLKQSARRYAFQTIDQFRELMRGLCLKNNVNMINFSFHSNQLASAVANQRSKNFFESIANFSRQYRAAIFHAPYNVIGEQIYRMSATFKFIFHTLIIAKTNYTNNGFMPYLCGFDNMQPRAAFIPDQDKAFWSGTSAG
jgi:hypothetical protein